jgi:hypothetical protein
MRCLTIRQPWAYAIFCLGKDIENRDWFTRVRGRIAIHAAAGMTRKEYDAALLFIRDITDAPMPLYTSLARGMVLGTVEIVDCVRRSPSPWFMGEYGFVLREPRLLPQGPEPAKGSLGFWDWP